MNCLFWLQHCAIYCFRHDSMRVSCFLCHLNFSPSKHYITTLLIFNASCLFVLKSLSLCLLRHRHEWWWWWWWSCAKQTEAQGGMYVAMRCSGKRDSCFTSWCFSVVYCGNLRTPDGVTRQQQYLRNVIGRLNISLKVGHLDTLLT